jgi:tryptophan halogenase
MTIPPSLAERIAIYRENARQYRHDNELFTETSWFAVMHGQNILPQRYHPVADILPEAELQSRMLKMADVTQKCLIVMPTHREFIDRYCKAAV